MFAFFAWLYLGENLRSNYAMSMVCILAAVGFAVGGKD